MRILLTRGRLLDLQTGEFHTTDIRIEGSHIIEMGENLPNNGDQVIDIHGKWVFPGLVDMHVHLREPGFEQKETIHTGSQAAARGGFTTIACMPNTRPITDSVSVVEQIVKQAEKSGYARVLPIGAITIRELGKELTDMKALKEAGIVAVSDDGVGIQSSQMMREAMAKAQQLGLPVVAHCEDNTLAGKGVVHEGEFAAKYDLPGIPNLAESVHVGRDILLAEETGAHYHVCHISTAESVRLVREAKSRGQKVTAEVTPHHLLLCDEDIPNPDPNWKMNPPLRSRADRQALLEGLQDGTIDFIATDHAPHTEEEKAAGMELAPFGIVGLETAFPLLYTHLVLTGKITLLQLIQAMSQIPAQRFGLPYGELQVGGVADLVVIDPEYEAEIDPRSFLSKGRNTPFTGWKVKGWPILTLLAGEVTWQANL